MSEELKLRKCEFLVGINNMKGYFHHFYSAGNTEEGINIYAIVEAIPYPKYLPSQVFRVPATSIKFIEAF